jgi:hypothetical protein
MTTSQKFRGPPSESRGTPVENHCTRVRVDDQGIMVRFGAGARDFYLINSVQTGYGDHFVSGPLGTGGCSPGDKAAGL